VSIVSSHNDWDPLEEVIVGTAVGSVQSSYEDSMAPFFPLQDEGRRNRGGPYPPEAVIAAQRQLDGLAARLEREGVLVRRPTAIDHDVPFSTPDFAVPRGHGQTCPRDSLLVLGSTIIEVPMAMRARFFEYRAYRTLMREYFEGGACWLAPPRPLLDYETYAEDYTTELAPYRHEKHASLRERDPLFDAACFLRLGRDIFWQPDIVSNLSGFRWLVRHFGGEYRFHVVQFRDRAPEHIDTTFVPLRPGLMVSNPERPCDDSTLRMFDRNEWRVVHGPPSVREGIAFAARDVSNWISLNFLSLDPCTVIAEAAERPLHDFLRNFGCDVIPVEFDAVFAFGGSFHCSTLDIRRNGPLESYFPELVS
jgi:glycine amidinotransferase